MVRQLKQGAGWRIGWDGDAPAFKGLIGGDEWALELTEAELEDFCRLISQLTHTMSQLASELMDEEKISCEAESPLLWLEAEGFPHTYSLRVLVLTGRRSEGFWTPDAVPELIRASQMLNVF
jgi:Domain of unknown function (DUF1818)